MLFDDNDDPDNLRNIAGEKPDWVATLGAATYLHEANRGGARASDDSLAGNVTTLSDRPMSPHAPQF